MRHVIILLSFLTLSIHADFKSDLAKEYARGINSILFFTSEDMISSGHYTFDEFDGTLDSYFFPFKYAFKSDCDDYNYFINGSIGFSDYKENNINLNRNSQDAFEFRTYALKLGGGTRFNTSLNTHLNIGAAYIYSHVNGNYISTNTLDLTDPHDKVINEILNSNQNHHTLEVSTSFKYHPIVNDYQPFASIGLRHFRTRVDDTYAIIPDIKSTISNINIGMITPPVTEVYGLPLRIEPYASMIYLSGDIDNGLNLDKFYVLGTTFRFGSYALTCWVEDVTELERDTMNWIKELTFEVNFVKGHNFDGLNVGLGVKF